MNHARTYILLAAMTGLFLAIGALLGGQMGMIIAFVVALAMNAFSYWNSDKMVLRMHGAMAVDQNSAPEYYDIVAQLANNADLPMPKVYIMENPQPNAFATGRNPEHAAVAATTGLLETLSREEVAGVMAHELAHIKNRDTLTMTITATLAGAISMLANFAMFFGGGRDRGGIGLIGSIAIMILAPMGAALVQMAISRTREYAADRLGAEISGRPMWLGSALDKMSTFAKRIENPAAERNPASAHLFIVNPLSGKRADKLFSTHPDTANRIAELQKLADEWGTPGARGGSDHQKDAGAGPWNPAEQKPAGPWD